MKLRLVENDYAILRAWEQRASFATYISIVVQRMMLDFRIHSWGKWHPSAEAKRLGPLALQLEQLLERDGRSFDDAVAVLSASHEGATRESLQALAERLPRRPPRRREVELEEAEGLASPAAEEVEERVLTNERHRVSERVSAAMTTLIERLPEEDRLILQLRFEGAMTVAQIARMLRLDQKLLYRRIEQRMRELRAELQRSGIAASDVLDLIGREGVDLEFRLRKRESRPSIPFDETAAAHSEVSP